MNECRLTCYQCYVVNECRLPCHHWCVFNKCRLPCHHRNVIKRMLITLPSLICCDWDANCHAIIERLWNECRVACCHICLFFELNSDCSAFIDICFFLNAAFPAFIIMSWTNADCPAFIDMLWMNVDCPAIIKILWTSEDYPAIIDMKECRLPCNYLDKMSKCGLPCRHRYAMNKCELPCHRIFLPSLIFKMQITLRSWYTIVKEIQITQPSLMYCKWMRIPCHHWYVVKWMRIILPS